MRKEWLNPRHKIAQLDTSDVFEINSKPKSVKDDKLPHVGSAVLQLSKLHLLKFIYFLEEHLEPGGFKILYLDTDSIFLALTKTLDMPENFEGNYFGTWRAAFSRIVKNNMKLSWEENSKKWFVLDQTVESKRKPGIFDFHVYFF